MTTIYLVSRYSKSVEEVELIKSLGSNHIEYNKNGLLCTATNWFFKGLSWFENKEEAIARLKINRDDWIKEKTAELAEVVAIST